MWTFGLNNGLSMETEFDNFLKDVARCTECTMDVDYACCPEHSDEWNQVYKQYWELLK